MDRDPEYEEKKMKNVSRLLVLGIQHVFAMAGATILVPLLTGLDVGVALFTSGIGTLIYIICTKGKVPMYLGSSFAYMGAVIAAFSASGNFSSAFIGIIAVGIIYIITALVIMKVGSN
jgi:uracil permease